MIDDISRFSEFYICHISDKKCSFVRKPKGYTLYGLCRTRPWRRKSHNNRVGVLSLDYPSDFSSSDSDIKEFFYFIIVYLLGDKRRSIWCDCDTRDFGLRFERDIERTFDSIRYFYDFFSESFEGIEIFSEDFDHQRSTDS